MFGKTTSAPAHKAPISSHPIFPVVVAIWFAALLGIGSLILPVILFEKIFAVTGVSSLVPAAQAPLGFTARMLIAIAAATGGAIAGVFVARKVAASQTQGKSKILRNDDGAFADDYSDSKRPISALEELGSDSLDEPIGDEPRKQESYKGKRRSLAVTDESGPSDFLELAPLPGGDIAFDEETLMSADNRHQPLDLDEFADESDEDEAEGAELLAELNGPFARPAANHAAPDAGQTAGPTTVQTGVDFAAVDASDNIRPTSQPHSETPAAETLREELAPMTEPTDQKPAAQQDSGTYNPLADKRYSDEQYAKPFSPVPPASVQPQVKFTTPVAPAAMPAPEPVAQAQSAPPANHAKPLDELGMVELVERFASALQSKKVAPEVATLNAHAPEQQSSGAHGQESVAEHAAVPVSFQPPAEARPQTQPLPHLQPAPVEPAAQPAVAAAAEPATSPLVFRRASAPQNVAATVPDSTFEQVAANNPADPEVPVSPFTPAESTSPAIPSALQPLGFDDGDEEDDLGENADLGLSIDALRNPAPQQPAEPAVPAPFAAPEPVQPSAQEPVAEPEYAEVPESDDSYSSLLTMRNALGANREFVRIEEDDAAAPAEPVVVFPGQDSSPAQPEPAAAQFQPQPAADAAPRPFDSPVTQPVRKSGEPAPNAGETERALREALEKLQRMSGAA